ncbi:hypothetical protein OEZ49_11830 [Ruegeria sp. WL0004]|uniref:Uncharacterized protein n=1 Tax=Ruegeria marisflavi TaxID=2984152 RepID=A0ABT2WRC4_9RHOB|nr:hypothetical protein [Ruegeria sp. WL0004]MCU9838458.1 hypothetical protein [Ruegeria sp. WL0004]
MPRSYETALPASTGFLLTPPDISLVTTCMDLGRRAAEAQADDATARLCVRIANDCQLISDMKMDQTFPAQFGRSQVFESFAATRERHL